jgi:hypothetical protein
MIFEVSRTKTIVISGVAVGSMLTVAYMAAQNGEPASNTHQIPPIQLATGTGSIATATSSIAWISGDAVSHPY